MMTRSASWSLFAVLVGSLATTACKKDSDSKPPEDGGGTPAADDGGADGADGGDKEPADGVEFMTVEVFEEVLQANTEDVLECYQDTKAKKPTLGSGKLVIDFTMDGTGLVSDIKADDTSTIKDDDLNACIKEKTKGWKFPKTRDGEPMTLPYTFSLS